ncbi:MAG: hypothetical protein AB1916_10085 [Thermodesulfobacteriota bacterium]
MNTATAEALERGHVYKSRAAEALGLEEKSLHALDMEDILLSVEAMQSIGRIACRMLSRYVPRPADIPRRMAGIMAGLSEEVYWCDATGQLVLCADLHGDFHAIQVPLGHWTMRPHRHC